MNRRNSKDTDQAYLNGKIISVAEIKRKFVVKKTADEKQIFEILLKATKPITSNEICKKIERNYIMTNEKLRELFEEGLVIRLNKRTFLYLLSKKGYEKYIEMKDKNKHSW